jgi:two-component system, LytTR family, response regulator
MIHAIAVDDEMNALGIIQEYSQRIADLDLVQSFTDPTKALQFANASKKPIDLVFLDIQMSRLNGLTLAEHLPENCRIILTTAYPDYALQGYEMDVVDYLLKPFSLERFERAVQKVRLLKNTASDVVSEAQKKIKPAGDDFIFVRTDYKTIKVKISDITYIEGSGNYVTLHTIKGKILVLQNLKKFEEQLMPYQFIRVHKSFIVSLSHIESIEKGWILIDKQEIPIGESYRDPFQQFLNRNYKQF